MSQTEIHKGTLIPLNKKYSNEFLINLLKENSIDYKEEDIEDYKYDVLKDFYIDKDQNLYKVADTELDEDDIFEIKKNEDGSFDYILSYYNGGCSFNEALDYAFKKGKIHENN